MHTPTGQNLPPGKLDRLAAVPMFLASLLQLAMIACVVAHLRFIDTSYGIADWGPGPYLLVLGLGYLLFPLETFLHWLLGSPRWKQGLAYCLLPPLRMGARDFTTGRFMWLPRFGWQEVDDTLRIRVERAMSGPMIAIALLILPVLAAELFWLEKFQPEIHPYLHLLVIFLVEAGTSLIWVAFTIEFIVMFSLVPRKKRFEYCRTHWVDLAIICLPLLAFLRVLRLGALLRLGQLGRMSRIYRVRGVAMRAYRGVLMLDMLRRFIKVNPEKRRARLAELIEEKEHELAALRRELAELEPAAGGESSSGGGDSRTDAASPTPEPHVASARGALRSE